MKQVSTIVFDQTKPIPQPAPLSDAQKDSVAYFFMRLRVIYANQYLINMPDESTEKFTKREYARQVCDLTREQMDEGFRVLHQQRQSNPEDWRFMDIDKVIGLIKTGGKTWQQRVLEAKDREPTLLIEQKRSEETKQRVSQGIAELRKGLK